MKKSVFIVMIICCIFGCSNNDAEKSVTREDVDLGDVISWDEFISSDSVDFTKWDSCFFTQAPSPNCGMDPNNNTNIGYASSINGNNVTLATKLVYINSDLSGVSYNMWYTRSPSNLEWNYILIN